MEEQRIVQTIPLEAGSLSYALSGTAIDKKVETKTIVLEVINSKEIRVTLTGSWTGNLLRAALRQIEHRYNKIKHDALRQNVVAAAKLAASKKVGAKK